MERMPEKNSRDCIAFSSVKQSLLVYISDTSDVVYAWLL